MIKLQVFYHIFHVLLLLCKSLLMRASFFLCLFLYPFIYIQSQEHYAQIPDWYKDYDVKFYKIDIEADNTTTDVKGCAEVTAEVMVSGLKQFTLELAEAIHVDSVWMNHQKVSFRRDGDYLHAICPAPLQVGALCDVKVFYAAVDIKADGFFSAISNRADNSWNVPVTWTLSEPTNAKNWFPCKQYLPDKADSAHIFITVPQGLKAGAPGVLTAITPMPGNKFRYEWKTRYPVAYYLLSFAVADYQDYTIYAHPKGVDKPVPVQNYIYNRNGYLDAHKAVIDTTAALIELFSELYLPYPFANEKYGHCVAPMGGGMEHQTMTTLSDFDFLLVAHELAHQWFGDLVTCASFQDVWINEGFTTYTEYLALERMASREKALGWMREAHAIATWSQSGSVFVPAESADDTWRIFSMSLSYKKGAVLVHNIRRIINNDEKFFEILRGFLRQYSFSVATGMDFKQFAEKQSGIDFTDFFDQWYFGEGFPIFDISWKKGNGEIEILVEHTGSASSTPLFKVDLDARIMKADGTDTIINIPVRTNHDIFRIKIAGNITGIEIDPDYYVLKQLQSNTLVRDLPTNDRFVRCNTRIKRKQNLEVAFASEADRNCVIKLTDANNEKVFTEMAVKRKKEVVIPMEQYPNGTYILYVQDGKQQYIRKIVKSTY